MTKLQSIEREITSLTPAELTEFRQWYQEFDARVWDRQLEQDADAGKLDALAEAALRADYESLVAP
ncbi:MAG: hypothetical protein QOJ16_2616 [Acidobacteriota bacterium]|jgi:putative hemolysin|nr:hypothetical protein [Acidobacteriota bacterium]